MLAKIFSRNTLIVVVTLIFVLLLQGGAKKLFHHYSPETVNYSKSLVAMDTPMFDGLLKNAGRPTLVFIYASWCPYCQKEFTSYEMLKEQFPDSTLQTLAISIDKDPLALSDFLLTRFPNKPFTPYHLDTKEIPIFFRALGDRGPQPKGSIPYMVLFDADQKFIQEFSGLVPFPTLREAIQKLKSPDSAHSQ